MRRLPRIDGVYVHPFHVLQLRTMVFCPFCLPLAPWIQQGVQKLAARSKQSLRLKNMP